jgi:hypothetical protein
LCLEFKGGLECFWKTFIQEELYILFTQDKEIEVNTFISSEFIKVSIRYIVKTFQISGDVAIFYILLTTNIGLKNLRVKVIY